MKTWLANQLIISGTRLWENGGWSNDTYVDYKDLKMSGKIGFNMFCLGCKLKGWTAEDVKNMVEKI